MGVIIVTVNVISRMLNYCASTYIIVNMVMLSRKTLEKLLLNLCILEYID